MCKFVIVPVNIQSFICEAVAEGVEGQGAVCVDGVVSSNKQESRLL